MKPFFLLFTAIVLSSAFSPNGKPVRNIEIYSVRFDSQRLINQPSWGPETDCSIAYSKRLVTAKSLYEHLGGTYTISAIGAQPKKLLNLAYTERDERLDAINHKYYTNYGFDLIEKRTDLPSNLKQFRADFEAASTEGRTKLLKENRQIREALEESRYDDEKYSLTATAEVEKVLSLDLTGKLAFPFSKVKKLAGNAKLEGAIGRVLKLTSTAENLAFHIIRLNDNYVRITRDVLSKYQKPAEFDKLPEESFGLDLRNFLKSEDQAILVGSAVFDGTFNTKTTRDQFIKRLRAEVTATLPKIGSPSDTTGFAKAVIEAADTRDQNVGVGSGHKYWYFSFARMSELELQYADPAKPPFVPCTD